MSRCFPFPPPGYEKKAIPDDTNLLIKEKHKDKKHKKDKKDKEKREGKDKKDKERSKEKHKEKKERKEKHKDRKEKDRNKEKKTSEANNITTSAPGCQNGEKVSPNYVQGNETNDFKFVLELGKRTRDAGGAAENPMVQKITATDQNGAELPGKVVGNSISHSIKGNEKHKERREEEIKANGQRNGVAVGGVENAVQSVIRIDQKKVEGVARAVEKDVGKQMEEQEKNRHKDSDIKRDREREKKSKSKDKKRHKEKEKEKKDKKEKKEKKESKKDSNKQLPIREISKDVMAVQNIRTSCILKETNKDPANDGNLGKRKEPEMNGFLHANEVRPIKLPRPVSSSHQDVENVRKLEPYRTGLQLASDGGEEGVLDDHKSDNKVFSFTRVLENGRKAEPRHPASLNESDPHLLVSRASEQRTVSNHKLDNKSSLYPVPENGRKLEQSQNASKLLLETSLNNKKDKEALKINGLEDAKQPNVCSMKPSSVPLQVQAKVETFTRPPHPDSKYLNQILLVPKMEELLNPDDQEVQEDWLFSGKNQQAEKSERGYSDIHGAPQVWGEAVLIESADITALPYVIPY